MGASGRERRAVLVTGAAGYIGRQVVAAMSHAPGRFRVVVAADVRPWPVERREPGVVYAEADVRSQAIPDLIGEYAIDTVVHLAAVVTPGRGDTRKSQYDVDVGGTRNVLEACIAHGVRKLIYTSSGAAYGYTPDNPPLLHEDDPLRGNEAFAYAWHKRLVEEMLAEYREQHPDLAQLVFRVSTILGPSVNNQITAHFERPVVVGIAGVASPFCFILDQDVVRAVLVGIHGEGEGVFNLAGDGVMTLREIAHGLGRRYGPVKADRLRRAFSALKRLGLTTYGEEQMLFLQYRPVLANLKLKTRLGFRPRWGTREVFGVYRRSRVRPTAGEPGRFPVSRSSGLLGDVDLSRYPSERDRKPIVEALAPLAVEDGIDPGALPIPEPL